VPEDVSKVVTIDEDGCYLWLEQESSVMLKSVTSYGDPVELSLGQVEDLIAALEKCAARLRADLETPG
jgi:hypothetical protein